jgi:hypothetical protein
VTFAAFGIICLLLARRFLMRIILLVAAAILVACSAGYAQDPTKILLAQASPAPAAEPAPALAAPAPAPAAQAQPDAIPQTAAKPSKPAKKRVAKRRSWQSDEAKARSIASKYGVTW